MKSLKEFTIQVGPDEPFRFADYFTFFFEPECCPEWSPLFTGATQPVTSDASKPGGAWDGIVVDLRLRIPIVNLNRTIFWHRKYLDLLGTEEPCVMIFDEVPPPNKEAMIWKGMDLPKDDGRRIGGNAVRSVIPTKDGFTCIWYQEESYPTLPRFFFPDSLVNRVDSHVTLSAENSME